MANIEADLEDTEEKIIDLEQDDANGKDQLNDPEQDGIESLKEQLAKARKQEEAAKSAAEEARQQAQQRAEEARKYRAEVEQSRTEVSDQRLNSITTALSATEGEANIAKGEYAQAMEAGDYQKAAEAQYKLSETAAKAMQLKAGKAALEAEIQLNKDRPPRQEEHAKIDPFEARLQGLAPKAQAWLREHPECLNDSRENSKMLASHYAALGEGISANSPEYFEFMDERMGYVQIIETESPTPPPKKAKFVPTAPVSRRAPNNNGQNLKPNQVSLTREELAAADVLEMTPRQYAVGKIEMLKRDKQAGLR